MLMHLLTVLFLKFRERQCHFHMKIPRLISHEDDRPMKRSEHSLRRDLLRHRINLLHRSPQLHPVNFPCQTRIIESESIVNLVI
jgi:hypothetical protein